MFNLEFTVANTVLASLIQSALASYFFPNFFSNGALTSFLAAFLACNFSIFALHRVFVYPFFQSPLRHLPQAPDALPFIGHAKSMLSRPKGNAHLNMMKSTDNDGLVLFRGFFHSERLILTNPAAIADVLVHNNYDFEKPPLARMFLRKFLGDGLLMTEGDEHKHHRKQIIPAFHFRNIQNLYPVFWAKSIEFCSVIKNTLHEDPAAILEIGHYATQVTLDIIGLAGLGRDIGSLKNSDDELIDYYEELLEPTTEKAVYFALHLIFPPTVIGMLPWKLNHRVKLITSNLKRICKDFVVEQKTNMKHESQEGNDILSIMIRSNNFSDDNLVDQLLTFLAAGHETTSSALTWASYLLSTHPDAQKRLRDEIHEHIADPKSLYASDTSLASILESMPYLNGVCNETLRLFPTVPITARISIRDTKIGDQFIPKDTMIFVVPWAVNRNPKLWGEDAEEFVPTRWIDPDTGRATMHGGAGNNYAFLTFLHGPRSCIGERFARAELRALLAAMVGSFEFQMADPNEQVVVGGTITSKPVNGMRLRLKPVPWGDEVNSKVM